MVDKGDGGDAHERAVAALDLRGLEYQGGNKFSRGSCKTQTSCFKARSISL